MNRILQLHRDQTFIRQIDYIVKSIYSRKEKLSLNHIPFCLPHEHTMFHALDTYVEQKLPFKEIFEVLNNGGRIEVHGIYPSHFEVLKMHSESGWEEINFYHKPSTRKYNVVRPRFLTNSDKTRFILCVAPGSDYIQHYGAIVRHACWRKEIFADIELYYYPTAFETLASWTHLHKGFIGNADIVIIGYVQEVHEAVLRKINMKPLRSAYNPYLESRRYVLPNGSVVNFLGVNFSFWGNLSAVLTQGICLSGASEILYVGKLGSLQSAESLYEQLYVPSKYAVLNCDQLISQVDDVRNGLLEAFPHLDTGMHVSVPTVLEEDYRQRGLANTISANSIDNEISQIAFVISNFNSTFGRDVKFSSFHFATDYLRNIHEKDKITGCDLSNNRDNHVLSKKEFFLKKNVQTLIDYLGKL